MSAKLLYTLSDENPDLHKQFGCMNGILQVFYRQHFPGRRVSSGHHNQKTLPPGQTNNQGNEPSNAMHKTPERSTKKKTAKEKQKVSTESSSRASFPSSPRSSSFSSVEVGATTPQLELPVLTRTTFCENPIQEVPKLLPNCSPQWSHRMSPDLRDVVKGSIHKETRGLSVKTTTKEEVRHQQTFKHADSPRPSLQRPTSSRELRVMKESFSDSPRLSYDERELRNGQKSNAKLRELPRLSLDSREHSLRRSKADMKSNDLPGDGTTEMNGQQEPGSHRRTSSIVAKLMGLEISPDSISTICSSEEQIKASVAVAHDSFSRSSITTDDNKQSRFYNSPRHPQREAASPRSRNADSVKKLSATSKFPMEPAPWKHPDGGKDQRLALKTQIKVPNSNVSVYGEIQKRLTQLEFNKSGKDLRALKQILEAMEKTQQTLESTKERTPNSASLTSRHSSLVQGPNQLILASTATDSLKTVRSPIVMMKAAETFGRVHNSASRVNHADNSRNVREDMARKQIVMDITPRLNHYKGPPSQQLHSRDNKSTSARPLQSKQTLKETYPKTRNVTKSGKNQNDVNVRTQQKRQPQSITCDSSRSWRQHGRQQTEASSPRRRPRTKVRNLQQTDDQMSDVSSDKRSLSHQSDARSLRSESNISSTSNADIEVTSKYRFDKIIDISGQHTPKQENLDLGFSQDRSFPEPVKLTLEQPSPVSVLDAALYGDESPSPVRKISTAFKEEDPLISEEAGWIHEETDCLSRFRRAHLLSENQKLTSTDSTLDEFIIHETSIPCNSRNPDYKYISEILLASGLLEDLEYSMLTIQLHKSRLPINPNLFFALEQSKISNEVFQEKHKGKRIRQIKPVEKVKRKLVFDTVNEVLAQKFISQSCSKPWIPSSMLMDKRARGQQLLQTLCSEIDWLQASDSNCSLDDEDDFLKSMLWEDMMHQGTRWTQFQEEIPEIVLDVERLIFKDLINEVVTGEVAALKCRHSGHQRQLFTD